MENVNKVKMLSIFKLFLFIYLDLIFFLVNGNIFHNHLKLFLLMLSKIIHILLRKFNSKKLVSFLK